MSENITAHVEEKDAEMIDALADHHDISRSRAINLLLREGINARATRLRLAQVEAKVDLILESFAQEDEASKLVAEKMADVIDVPVPDETLGTDLVDEPLPAFQAYDIRPDDWEGPNKGLDT